MKNENLELINEILECLDMLYENNNGVHKLPNKLSEYAGLINVIYSQAKELKNNIENM